MSSLRRSLNDFLKCTVCLERFKNPIVLPCQHTFCKESCLEGLVDNDLLLVKCHDCKIAHPIPDQGLQAFPRNHTIFDLLEIEERKDREVVFERCNECKGTSHIEQCPHCDNKLCEECLESHTEVLRGITTRMTKKITDGLLQVAKILTHAKENIEQLQTCSFQAHQEVEEAVCCCLSDVTESGKKLKRKIDAFVLEEIQKVGTRWKKLEEEYISICIDYEMLEKSSIEKESEKLVECKNLLLRILKFLENFNIGTNLYERRITFHQSNNPEVLRTMLKNLGDIEITSVSTHILTQTDFLTSSSGNEYFDSEETHTESAPVLQHEDSDLVVTPKPVHFVLPETEIREQNSLVRNATETTILQGSERIMNLESTCRSQSVLNSSVFPFSKYIQKGRVLMEIGHSGTESSLLMWPRSVAVGLNDSIVIADSYNDTIQVFDSSGMLINTFGGYGSGEGEFNNLTCVAVNCFGQFIVSDTFNHRIQIFDFSGSFHHKFGSKGNGDGYFNLPCGILTDSNDFIYVCDKMNSLIKIFQPNGNFVKTFWSIAKFPKYIAVNNNNHRLYISDTYNHCVRILRCSDGQYRGAFGTKGSGPGQFKFPKGIAIDSQGYIIVCDSGNNRVQIFNPDNTFLLMFDTRESNTVQQRLQGIAVMSNGNILVCDPENRRIQVF